MMMMMGTRCSKSEMGGARKQQATESHSPHGVGSAHHSSQQKISMPIITSSGEKCGIKEESKINVNVTQEDGSMLVRHFKTWR